MRGEEAGLTDVSSARRRSSPPRLIYVNEGDVVRQFRVRFQVRRVGSVAEIILPSFRGALRNIEMRREDDAAIRSSQSKYYLNDYIVNSFIGRHISAESVIKVIPEMWT